VDRGLLVSFLGLAATFVAVTMPLVLSRQWVTASWAIQAVVLLWMAERLESGIVRRMALALLGIVFVRFCTLDLGRTFLPGGSVAAAAAELPVGGYLRLLAERAVAFGTPIAAFGVAARLVGRTPRPADPAKSDRGDVGLASFLWLAGIAALLFYVHLEVDRTAEFFFPPARLPLLSIVWVAIGAIFLREYAVGGSPFALALVGCVVMAVLLKLFTWDLPAWGVDERLVAGPGYSALDAGLRALDFGVVIALLAAAYAVIGRARARTDAGPLLAVACLGTLFAYLTLETNSFLAAYYPGFRAGGVSIVWAIFALALVLAGIARNVGPLRWVGLGLFAIVSGKVFLHDLASLDTFWRIVAFIILGLLLIAGSFVYLKYREKFTVRAGEGRS
jgi:uncharacterized membrane protein